MAAWGATGSAQRTFRSTFGGLRLQPRDEATLSWIVHLLSGSGCCSRMQAQCQMLAVASVSCVMIGDFAAGRHISSSTMAVICLQVQNVGCGVDQSLYTTYWTCMQIAPDRVLFAKIG